MARKSVKNKSQHFSITAPDAMSVMLAGDFTHWEEHAIPLRRAAGGVWSVAVDVAPGIHHYRFIVDGQWRDDPSCTLRVANPFGTENSVRDVA